jgi:hypothetical protein
VAHLGTVTYNPNPKFALNRAYFGVFAFTWVADHTLISGGNPYIWQSAAFGNVRVFLRFDPTWFSWNSNNRTLDKLILDYYALLPPYTTPISPGAHAVTFGYTTTPEQFTIAIEQPFLQKHAYYALPAPSPTFWFQPPPTP